MCWLDLHERNARKGDRRHSVLDSRGDRYLGHRDMAAAADSRRNPVADAAARRDRPGPARARAGPHPLPLPGRDRRGAARHHRGLRGAGGRRRAQADRHRVREPDQDDDLADHLLHDRARRRLGPQGRQGRRGRRPRPRLLPRHVDGGARHRPGGRQHPGARLRTAPDRGRAARGRQAGRGRRRVDGGLPARDHPEDDGVRLHRGPGPPDPPDRPARGLRAPGARLGRDSRCCAASSTSSGSSSASWRW